MPVPAGQFPPLACLGPLGAVVTRIVEGCAVGAAGSHRRFVNSQSCASRPEGVRAGRSAPPASLPWMLR
jgi:hypothetical protein